MEIFVVTMFENFDVMSNYTRTVGYFPNFEDAKNAVLNNANDISEGGNYNYSMIERVVDGLYPQSDNRWFYEYDFSNGTYITVGIGIGTISNNGTGMLIVVKSFLNTFFLVSTAPKYSGRLP